MKKKDMAMADDLIEYKLKLIKYGNKTTREVLSILDKLEKDILGQLQGEITDWKKSRLNKALSEIGVASTEYYKQIAATVDADLLPIPEVAQTAFNSAVSSAVGPEFTSVASVARLEALATSALIQGAPGKAWWKKQDDDLKFKVQNVIRQGYAQGTGVQTIAREVRDVMGISRRHAETLVRTSVMTVSNDALMHSYKQNSNVVKEVEWLATLDSRTCKYCMSMDGRTWPVDTKKPAIPAHYSCRCIYTPITKTFREMGFYVDEISTVRSSMDGPVSGDMSFDQFLKRKGSAFQNDMLGKGRADLWRDGKITISDLVNNRGRELSLAELKKM